MIKLENLEKIYSTPAGPLTVLHSINLQVPRGKIFAIVGKSGAGKSTLLRCVNLLERPSAGRVFVDGQELTSLTPSALRFGRRKIGMIFQHFNLLSSQTVRENIALPLILAQEKKSKIAETVTSLLELTDLVDKQHNYPDQLSGGQKQRVAIARALACQPTVLLCDEATSALDAQTTKTILELLKNINQKFQLTVLLITHEIDVVKDICDSVALLDQGKIVEQNDTLSFFIRPVMPLTKAFIHTSLKQTLPALLHHRLRKEKKPHYHALLRIMFCGPAATEPLTAYLMQKLNITLNILQAHIESIKQTAFGIMLAEVVGEQDNLQAGIDFLMSKGIYIEILGYVDPTVF